MDTQFAEWVEGRPYSKYWFSTASLEISLGTDDDIDCSLLSRVTGGA